MLDDRSNIVREYQDEPFFEDLGGGVYQIEVNDKNGCGGDIIEISLLEFTSFFTPNNDGINDFWQIKGISNNFYQSGNVNIFDRYGKLITAFSIFDTGWNGIYNGSPLPPNDYWFQVELVDQNGISRIRNGNFSLLRN